MFSVKHIVKKIIFLVSQLIKTLTSTAKVLLNIKHFRDICGAKEWKKEVVILANGPSFSNDIEKYKFYDTSKDFVCVNNFAESVLYSELRPSKYVLLDPGFWRDDVMENFKIQRESLYDNLNSKTNWNLELYLPVTAKIYFNKNTYIKNKNIVIKYFFSTPLSGFNNIVHFFYKMNLGMMHAQNVLVAAIFLALNAGAKKIYIFGADHSWHEDIYVDQENVVCTVLRRFYGTESRPFYKGKACEGTFKMHEILFALSRMFEGYNQLKKYSLYKNTEIYNASSKSYIDAFDRIDAGKILEPKSVNI